MSTIPFTRKRIAIFPASSWRSESRLLSALAELFPADFVPETEASFERADAAIFFSEKTVRAKQAFERGVSAFRFDSSPHRAAVNSSSPVEFSNHPWLHPAFRNARVPAGSVIAAVGLDTADEDRTLASRDSVNLWVFRSGGQAELHSTALEPPPLNDGQMLWSCLHTGNSMALLPLLHFLRRATADAGWVPPEQQACFIVDDPNLHSPRYGYLDFAELARHACSHNYHAAMATIPLDAGYAAPKVVELFQRYRARLSLLIHGNNHVKNELSRDYGEDEALRILTQALNRVATLERRTGLAVSRVVAAPHSACSEAIMAQMLRLPLAGACISASSLLRWNPHKTWPLSFALAPVCFMAEGFPVIQRFHLGDGLLPLRFAAFLGQPLVPYGHHWDCVNGLSRFEEVADTVNSWGPTRWTDLESIFRARYRTRRETDLLHIELCSRQVWVPVPTNVSGVCVHSQLSDDSAGRRKVKIALNGATGQTCALGVPFPVESPTVLEISMESPGAVELAAVGRTGYRLWPPVRRKLAIGRDRLLPILRSRRAPTQG